MTHRFIRAWSFSILVAALMATLLNERVMAICVIDFSQLAKADTQAVVGPFDVVLAGRVVAVQWRDDWWGDTLATIEVERVWKGDVPVLVTVYSPGDMAEAPVFEEGESLVLELSRHSNEGRSARLDLPANTLFISQCGDVGIQTAYGAALLKALGPGRPVR